MAFRLSQPQEPFFPLVKLPLELRWEIFRYAFATWDGLAYDLNNGCFAVLNIPEAWPVLPHPLKHRTEVNGVKRPTAEIVLTSKRIHDDVLDVLYTEKTFKLRIYACRPHEDVSDCFSALPQRVRQRIRKLNIGAIYDTGRFVACRVLGDFEFPTVLAGLSYALIYTNNRSPRYLASLIIE